ncbi:TetR/AcrR family transcriptional regulator [Alkalispirochaeta alkalica]|uniref:TetR/AcrR family transcriptional regulator n=1 Tax=Alkalispirochaeta alkalica TaxID=46356 RepID=UPI0003817B91|nr:TetR/AcrR family transcriptional regulator [Alkalispirochaeta alkalica]
MTAQNRKEQIIACARDLFLSRGYENTTISQIIDAAGIAKGTFYHHFTAKTDLIEVLVLSFMEEMIHDFDQWHGRTDISATERLQAYFDINSTWKQKRVELVVLSVSALYREENSLLLRRIIETSVDTLAPYFDAAVLEGVRSGEFFLPDPRGFGRFLLVLMAGTSHSQGKIILESIQNPEKLTEYADQVRHLEYTVNLLLGLPPGRIDLGVQPIIESIQRYLASQKEGRS